MIKEALGATNWMTHLGKNFRPFFRLGPPRWSWVWRGWRSRPNPCVVPEWGGAAGGIGAGDTAAATEGGATCPAVRGGEVATVAAGSEAGGGAVTAGGEEGLTRGLKEELCPLRVFAMVELGVGEEE